MIKPIVTITMDDGSIINIELYPNIAPAAIKVARGDKIILPNRYINIQGIDATKPPKTAPNKAI